MPSPVKPDIDYSYTGFQQEEQDFPFPGTQLDNDLAELKRGVDDTIDALLDVRRSDGALKNGIVTAESLSSQMKLLVGADEDTLADIEAVADNIASVNEAADNMAAIIAAPAQAAAAESSAGAASASAAQVGAIAAEFGDLGAAMGDIDAAVSSATGSASTSSTNAGLTAADRIATAADVLSAAASATQAAAAIGGTIYDTTAAGVAATINGQFFIVKGDGTSTYALMYKNVAGVATFVSDYQSVAGSRRDRGVTTVLSIACDMYPASVIGALDSNGALRFVNAVGPALVRDVVPTDITTAVDAAVSGIDASFGVTSRISISCDMYPVTVRGVLDSNSALRYVDAVAPALAALDGGGDAAIVAPTQFYLFVIGGQSNAVGQGDSGPTITAGIAKQYYSSALTDLASDPVGNANTGSAWPAFANKFFNLTGCGMVFVPTAVSGSAQAAAADRGAGHWDVGGVHYGASITKLNAAIAAVEAADLAWQLGGILWIQGEADAIEITTGTITDSVYYSALDAMVTRFESDTDTPFLPFLMAMTGQEDDGDPSGWPLVRAKQREFVKARANAFLAFTGAKNFAARSLMPDTYHYTQPGYDEMGEAMAVVAAAVCPGRA
ncbi:MAG: sialate O-acetylesterase [Mesorhizobium sp.]|uniref:sialate O-acetylesterase n=1 Tax=Mesorhizobium sp. TaxID=1871066 RepID=UPI0012254A4C|nr:sialate O-acetylesterase [Mesorhizobium sp.]TIL91707.1 MAG: sialate O-acetylesterase [Mesorhizobium sp.]TIL99629.1 MAG: sialate O-acetylesterase [Mesorhizobium sp.]